METERSMLPEEVDEPEFTVDSDSKAEWALRKIIEIDKRYDRLITDANAEIARYQIIINNLQQHKEYERARKIGLLENFYSSIPHDQLRRTKTTIKYDLPSGRLVEKLPSVKFEIDSDALTEWFKANGKTEYVKTIEKPEWGDFKKTLVFDDKVMDMISKTGTIITTDGEPVEGVVATMSESKFEVEV
jgi:hypothetical protein